MLKAASVLFLFVSTIPTTSADPLKISVDDSVKNNLANFRKLIGERTDCFIVDELAAKRVISQQGFDGLVEQLDTPVSVNAGYLFFQKP